MMTIEAFDRLFMPRAVAIAEVIPSDLGDSIRETLVASGFQGAIYHVGAQAQEASACRTYRSLADIPGPVDYVLCCTPVAEALPLLRDCVAKQVAVVSLLSPSWPAIDPQEASRIQREIKDMTENSSLRVIGPDCLGVYCPRAGLSFDSRLPLESGRTGFVCQRKEAALPILRAASGRGVRFSKAISYGYATDVSEIDLLEYLAEDGDTDTVAVCIDSASDGPRFFRVLKELATVKPIILLRTAELAESGQLPAEGTLHNASDQVWTALLKQTGAVGVNSAEGMVDAMVTFAMLPVPQGRRVGIFGAAGGASVLATDAWASTGFVLPPPPPELRAVLDDTAVNQAGMILHNPLDFSMVGYTALFFDVVKKMIACEGFIDLGIIHNPSGHGAWLPWPAFNGLIDSITEAVINIHSGVDRPLALVMQYIASRSHWQKVFEDLQVPCSRVGLPVYYSMPSAAKAIDRMLRYYEGRNTLVRAA